MAVLSTLNGNNTGGFSWWEDVSTLSLTGFGKSIVHQKAHLLFYKFTLYLVQKGKNFSLNIQSECKISQKIYIDLFTFYHGSSSRLFIQAQGELKLLYNTSEPPVTNLSVSNLPTLDKQYTHNAVQMFQSPPVVNDCSVTIGGEPKIPTGIPTVTHSWTKTNMGGRQEVVLFVCSDICSEKAKKRTLGGIHLLVCSVHF